MAEDLSLNDVLFEGIGDGHHRVVRNLLASPVGGMWRRGLAVGQRAVAELELAQQITTVLRFDLGDLMVRAWMKLTAVKSGAITSRQHPSDPVVVPLATHRIGGSKQPVIEVYAGNARVAARFEMRAEAAIALSGVELKLVDGRIMSVAAGSWSGTACLSCAGVELAKRSVARRGLPGVLHFGDGIEVDREPPPPAALRLLVDPAPCSGEATLALGPSLVIGRHPSCGIVFWDDPAVAGHHAGIHTLGDVVVLEDLGSSAGTYLNGRRMTAPAILRRGDDVQVGRRHLRVA